MGHDIITAIKPDFYPPLQVKLMQLYGADVQRCPSVPIKDERHYYPTARRWGQEPGHVWTDQFENLANAAAHHDSRCFIWKPNGSHSSLCFVRH